MLDVPAYRAAELLGRSRWPHWRTAPTLDAFTTAGFPCRIESLSDLGMLLDTMQEGRADAYRREMGELGTEEAVLLDQARRDQLEFVAAYFQSREPKFADDTLLAMFALYRKLCKAAPGFKRILEIGPGCGYLSFFLRQHEGLDEYAQVEACEPFYLLQHMVNIHCFGPAVRERVTQTAWWEVDHLDGESYDVVTANACLLEMPPWWLSRYLGIAAKALPRGGKFVAQCLGREVHGKADTLDAAFHAHGFTTASLRAPNANARTGGHPVWNGVWERA